MFLEKTIVLALLWYKKLKLIWYTWNDTINLVLYGSLLLDNEIFFKDNIEKAFTMIKDYDKWIVNDEGANVNTNFI